MTTTTNNTSATMTELSALHRIVAETLKRRLNSEDCTSADIAAAIRFLRDNGIEAELEANPDAVSVADLPDADDFGDGEAYGL